MDELASLLSNPTPEINDQHKWQLIVSQITTPDIHEDIISSIIGNAAHCPEFSKGFSQLCSDLHRNLPPFPSAEFKPLLLDNCSKAVKGLHKEKQKIRQMPDPERRDKEKALKLRSIAIFCFVVDLCKQKIMSESIVRFVIDQELLVFDREGYPGEKNKMSKLHGQWISFFEDYIRVCKLEEGYAHEDDEFMKVATLLALYKPPPCDDLIIKVLVKPVLRSGCLSYASGCEEANSTNRINSLVTTMGHLVVSGGVDFKVVGEVMKNMKDDLCRKEFFSGVKRIADSCFSDYDFGAVITQAADVAACESLLSS